MLFLRYCDVNVDPTLTLPCSRKERGTQKPRRGGKPVLKIIYHSKIKADDKHRERRNSTLVL
jgi:hypothetical protein